MNQYELKQAFTDSKRVYGTLVASPSPKLGLEITYLLTLKNTLIGQIKE